MIRNHKLSMIRNQTPDCTQAGVEPKNPAVEASSPQPTPSSSRGEKISMITPLKSSLKNKIDNELNIDFMTFLGKWNYFSPVIFPSAF